MKGVLLINSIPVMLQDHTYQPQRTTSLDMDLNFPAWILGEIPGYYCMLPGVHVALFMDWQPPMKLYPSNKINVAH